METPASDHHKTEIRPISGRVAYLNQSLVAIRRVRRFLVSVLNLLAASSDAAAARLVVASLFFVQLVFVLIVLIGYGVIPVCWRECWAREIRQAVSQKKLNYKKKLNLAFSPNQTGQTYRCNSSNFKFFS